MAPDDNPLWTGLARSWDGGETWTFSTFHGYPGDSEIHEPSLPFYGAAALRDPLVQFLYDGNLVVAGLILRAEAVDVYAAHIAPGEMQPDHVALVARGGLRAIPGGESLPPMLDGVPTPIALWLNDGPHMSANPDGPGIYLGAVLESVADPDGSVATPYMVTSQDGKTWSDAVLLAEDGRVGDPDGASYSAPRPLLNLDGRLHAFVREKESQKVMLEWISHDGGRTYEGPTTITTGLENEPDGGFWANANPDPQIDRSLGPKRGTLYITWSDTRNGDRDVFLVQSSGNGTWSDPRRVNDDPVSNGAAQFFPYLTVHPETGDLTLIFYDRREDPNDVEAVATMAFSDDGGQNFVNRPVAAVASSSEEGSNSPPNGASFLGTGFADYIDITHTETGSIGVWTDTRDATSERPFSQIYYCKTTPMEMRVG